MYECFCCALITVLHKYNGWKTRPRDLFIAFGMILNCSSIVSHCLLSWRLNKQINRRSNCRNSIEHMTMQSNHDDGMKTCMAGGRAHGNCDYSAVVRHSVWFAHFPRTRLTHLGVQFRKAQITFVSGNWRMVHCASTLIYIVSDQFSVAVHALSAAEGRRRRCTIEWN